ncbi:hypothetical protein EDF43_105167 [Rathayibacter sp. PhB179]|nr:hypothetical protein EDF49_105167 [Rathayibacter sp. PhB192]TCM27952.1 hypothetical protein EDF43_105167 [Rathayibacter sp. PhB179]
MNPASERVARSVIIAAGGGVVGAILRSLLPPFVLDEPFWRDFWSGPPTAGLFAVTAATIAFFPAFRSTRIARETAARDQWWKRAEWALRLSSSAIRADREVANDALTALLNEATETEARMIYRTIENLQGDEDVDTSPGPHENRQWRWSLWRR